MREVVVSYFARILGMIVFELKRLQLTALYGKGRRVDERGAVTLAHNHLGHGDIVYG